MNWGCCKRVAWYGCWSNFFFLGTWTWCTVSRQIHIISVTSKVLKCSDIHVLDVEALWWILMNVNHTLTGSPQWLFFCYFAHLHGYRCEMAPINHLCWPWQMETIWFLLHTLLDCVWVQQWWRFNVTADSEGTILSSAWVLCYCMWLGWRKNRRVLGGQWYSTTLTGLLVLC